MDTKNPNNIYERLTEREQEILELVLEGKPNQKIASNLYITINTVRIHIRNIIAKLNTGDDGHPPTGATVPRKPLPNGDGDAAEEELCSLLEKHLRQA